MIKKSLYGKGTLFVILLLLLRPLVSYSQTDIWPMKAHDTRRTGQSKINGPLQVTETWEAETIAAFVINIGATVTDNGVFFGSWGLLRNDSLGRDVRFWDKSDGKFYGLDINSGQPIWGGSLHLDLVHRCYEFENRPRTGNDLLFCGLSPYLVSFYNGTVEGQAAFDPLRNILYLGRGDGRLYAIDPDAGKIDWRFESFNPQLPEDPDGGGEIVSSPVIAADGTVYFGTWGIGPYETNAFYAVNPDSTLQWRFPSDSSLTGRPIFTSPAISSDNSTIYFGSLFAGDSDTHGKLFALNLSPPGMIPDDHRLKWEMELTNNGAGVWATTLAVGTDGTIYVGGLTFDSDGITSIPALVAIEDSGTEPVLKWSPEYVELRDGSQWVGGVALRELSGQTQRVYAATTNFRATALSQNQKEEGSLFAIEPETGIILADYDPSDDVPSAVGGLNSPAIGADGIIYFGVRGKFETNTVQPVNGHVFAVEYNEMSSNFSKVWNFEVEGHLEWNHPAIGPDGGIYIGSSVGSFTDLTTYDQGVVPPNTTCKFYAIKGPTNPVSVDKAKLIPNEFQLCQNYPNPFNPATTIHFDAPVISEVSLVIYNPLGQIVRILLDGRIEAGSHQLDWNGRDDFGQRVASGVYFLKMKAIGGANQHVKTQKMLLLQ